MNQFQNNKKVLSILLVEDQVDPGNINVVLNEIFGSKENYKLDNARSLFSSILKIDFAIANNYNYHLYMIDVRLKLKEDRELDFKSSFPSDISLSKYQNIYHRNLIDFENYTKKETEEVEVYKNFLCEMEVEENHEGYYVWSYLVSRCWRKVRALIYSASTSLVANLKWVGKSKVLYIMEKSLFSKLKTSSYGELFEDVKKIQR